MAGEFVDAPAPTFVDAPAPTKAKPISGVPQASAPLKPGVMFNNPSQKPAVNTSALDNAGTNAGNTIGNGITGALGLLQRVPDAWQALLVNGPGAAGGALMGDDQTANQVKVDSAVNKFPGGTNPIVHGIYKAGMNPLNLVDLPLGVAAKGRSVGQLATDALEGHSLPLAVQAGQKLAATGPVGQKITDTLAGVHDFMGVQSAAKRALATLHGPQWLDQYAKYRARLMQMGGTPDPAMEAQAAKEAAVVPPTAPPPGNIPAGVDPATGEYTPGVQGPATMKYSPSANDGAFAISPNKQARFAPQTGFGPPPKPKMTPDQAKSFYADLAAKKAAAAPAFSPEDQNIFDLMSQSNKQGPVGENPLWNLVSAPSDLMTAGMFAVPFGHMANISTLGALSDPTAVASALGRGTVNNVRGLGGAINNATGGKLPFLGTGGETADQLALRHAPAQAGGAISSHAFEQENPLNGGLDAGSNALDSLASGIKGQLPGVGGAIAAAPVQALSMVPKALSALYKASGNVLWKFDDEVKAQRFQNLVDGGMDPQRAGLRVGGELVDYENKAPIAGAIRPIAPFATWRTKAPLAVGRNVIENPGKASALANLAPAIFGGDQGSDPDTGQPYTSSLPPAELNTLLSDPLKYGKSTVSSPGMRLAGDLLGGLFEHGKRHGSAQADDTAMRKAMSQFTSGVDPLTYIQNQIPGYSQYLQASGNGMFGNGSPPSLQTSALNQLLVRPH